jgi:hypothetical protein
MQTRREYLELSWPVIPATGVALRRSGLLKIDLWPTALSVTQHVLAFEEKRSPAIVDFKIRLSVFYDVANAPHVRQILQISLKVVLRYPTANRSR